MAELTTDAKSILGRARTAVDRAQKAANDARVEADYARRMLNDAMAAQETVLAEDNVRLLFDAADLLERTDFKTAERLRDLARDMDAAGAIVGAP
ncbi:hypothetical protein [Mycobacterium sp.]|uniref:hypothetical protein n=1 Tax=Mycobacterium sp. TaxID=1785 RepID=UPI0026064B11|nr:hypothetical protein [Mycobacterium sp.]